MLRFGKDNNIDKIKQLKEVHDLTNVKLKNIATRFFQDSDQADDAVQETYIRIYKKLPITFENTNKTIAWASRICHNICIDIYRKKTRDKKLFQNLAYDFQKKSNFELDSYNKFENMVLQEIIEKVLLDLDSKERMIYIMYAFSGLTLLEIEEICKKKQSSIRSIIRKVNQKIARTAYEEGFNH